jgi:hypothetical protein
MCRRIVFQGSEIDELEYHQLVDASLATVPVFEITVVEGDGTIEDPNLSKTPAIFYWD